MPQLVTDCPRCGTRKTTFDVKSAHRIGQEYRWQDWYEMFCACRHCQRTTTFVLSQKTIDVLPKDNLNGGTLTSALSYNDYFTIEDFVSLKDISRVTPPAYIPQNIEEAFKEGAICLAVGANNGASTMFRLCLDHATRELLPAEDCDDLTPHIRRNLKPRIDWLISTSRLPSSLKDLSTCIREDGNEGAHGGTLTKADADNIVDFTSILLTRLYTEPEKLRIATERRDARKQGV